MRFAALIFALAALAATALAGTAGATVWPVKAKLSACHPALQPIDRSFDTDAAMRRIRGTARMAIRFEIQARRPGHTRYRKVSAHGFGVWFKSKRGVGAYKYSRTTNNLNAPAYYRMRVGFRWYGASGRAIKTVYRVTNRCAQPDLRPDLVVRGRTVTPKDATHDSYSFRVFNRGRTAAAAPFGVSLVFPDGTTKTKTILTDVAAGTSVRRTFTGPRCSAVNAPTALLDPDGAVDEAREGNNSLLFVCP